MYVELDGDKVRHERGSRGFNGAHFAREASISPTTLRRVEREEGPVSFATARKIAAALSVEPKSLGAASTRYVRGIGHRSGRVAARTKAGPEGER
jgi:transcriptional regulator with XRE-family HTH domain